MNAVCDNKGQWYLTGGFCVLLETFNTDKELLGVDENGWNGTVEASIDGNGRILFDPEVKLSDNEFIFVGDIDNLSCVPYQTIGLSSSSNSNKQKGTVEIEMTSND